ncbi:MAG: TraR/DksA family transcriptional regulator [Alphaproteobacteria bacterium]|nr:MAG: TraR/DksA family transcriptional regulator [Alphaproteobacteria bacterium]
MTRKTARKPIEERKAQLLALRQEIEERIEEIEDELDQPVDRDPDEASLEMEDDEVLEALDGIERKELAMIDAALRRIEEGEYGYCVKCGAEIAEERLDAVPFTPFCVKCASGQ